MSSTWVRTRCICWWWTHTPARARCPRTRTRRSCGSPNSSTRAARSTPRASTGWSPIVQEALQAAEDKGVEDLLPFATSAVREATNADEVLARVKAETGVELQVLTGAEEARLTFLAARRWFGWSAGKLLVLDIGGGSLEIAYGIDEEPDAAVSLPLGAGRLTAGWLPGDPPDPADVRALRRHVRAQIARTVGRVQPLRRARPRGRDLQDLPAARPHRGRRPLGRRPVRPARAQATSLEDWVPRLAAMTAAERAELPGVSEGRAHQLLAGAIVAEGAMDLFGVESWRSAPGRCARASSCAGWTVLPRDASA